MTLFEAGLLGMVQGLTEFLPISSSGHLVLFQFLFGLHEPMIAFDIVVHLGTLLAVFFYFRKDLAEMIRQSVLFLLRFPAAKDREGLFNEHPQALTAGFVILSTIPTALIGYLFKDSFEAMFGSIMTTGVAWILMGLLLLISRKFQEGSRPLRLMNHFDAFVIGVAQGISIIPAISRSGLTILAAMMLGIEKKDAARFSFYLSIPAILGAALLEMGSGVTLWTSQSTQLVVGFVSALVIGYLSIAVLLRFMARSEFHLFGWYNLAAGLFTLVYFFLMRPMP